VARSQRHWPATPELRKPFCPMMSSIRMDVKAGSDLKKLASDATCGVSMPPAATTAIWSGDECLRWELHDDRTPECKTSVT
jgi:hypothetical protein